MGPAGEEVSPVTVVKSTHDGTTTVTATQANGYRFLFDHSRTKP